MKLYFVNNNKINIYSLPTKVEDAFLLNYVYEDIEESLTLLAVDGKWQIESNPDVSIFFGTQIIPIRYFVFYQIYSFIFHFFNFIYIIFIIIIFISIF